MKVYVLIAGLLIWAWFAFLMMADVAQSSSTSVPETPDPQRGVLGPAFTTTAPSPTSLPRSSASPKVSRSAPRGTPSAKPTVTTRHTPLVTSSRWVELIRDCIARRESGRNPTASSPTGKYTGMYQFDRYSWHAATGLLGIAADYPASVQTQAFYVWFDGGRGRHRWATYGYCQNLYGGPE